MFLDKKSEEQNNRYSGRVTVGMELSDESAQISFFTPDAEQPETLSTIAGKEQFRVPTVVAKVSGKDQWLYGQEALERAQKGEAFLVKDLIFLAEQRLPVVIEALEYDPADLLGLFMKRFLFLLNTIISTDKIESVQITVKNLTPNLLTSLEQAVLLLHLPKASFYFASYKESFFQYILHQDRVLWNQEVLLFSYEKDGLQACRLFMNRHTEPVVTFIEEEMYPGMRRVDLSKAQDREEEARALDKAFFDIAQKLCYGRSISTVYLLGDGFDKEWCKDSLRFLCNNRRVFQGNNLYSKGACYGALEKLTPSVLMQSYIYLSDDKLKANLGMQVMRQGKEVYMALLDAGTSWYEAKLNCDFILEDDNMLPIIVTPINGKNIKVAEISLEGMAIRGNKTNRIHMDVHMKDEKTVSVTVNDLGFGELYPASGQVWQEEFEL